MTSELIQPNATPQLLARVAVARNATVVADPSVGDREIRRDGRFWFCSERTARELNALLSHR